MGGGLVAATSASSAVPAVIKQNQSAALSISRDSARQVAVRHIERRTGQQARATWSGRENDNGAQWEIEVTTRNGREFDVYVSSRGKVVKVVRKSGPKKSKPAPSPTRSPATDGSRESARQIAVAHMQREFGMGARATWSGREDDFGAQWEIEVTLADGREFDVYVNSAGEVVRVR
jgi:hypothetical protein